MFFSSLDILLFIL